MRRARSWGPSHRGAAHSKPDIIHSFAPRHLRFNIYIALYIYPTPVRYLLPLFTTHFKPQLYNIFRGIAGVPSLRKQKSILVFGIIDPCLGWPEGCILDLLNRAPCSPSLPFLSIITPATPSGMACGVVVIVAPVVALESTPLVRQHMHACMCSS